jgi:hypothetical protein
MSTAARRGDTPPPRTGAGEKDVLLGDRPSRRAPRHPARAHRRQDGSLTHVITGMAGRGCLRVDPGSPGPRVNRGGPSLVFLGGGSAQPPNERRARMAIGGRRPRPPGRARPTPVDAAPPSGEDLPPSGRSGARPVSMEILWRTPVDAHGSARRGDDPLDSLADRAAVAGRALVAVRNSELHCRVLLRLSAATTTWQLDSLEVQRLPDGPPVGPDALRSIPVPLYLRLANHRLSAPPDSAGDSEGAAADVADGQASMMRRRLHPVDAEPPHDPSASD